MVGTAAAQQFVRWGLRHGILRRFLVHRARSGDVGARIMIDPELRDDPYPYYEQLRARGRLVVTGLAPTTVDHTVCTAVLRPCCGCDRAPNLGSTSPADRSR